MLNIILVETALELVPQRIWDHPQILEYCKKRKKSKKMVLLDISYHFKAMTRLEDWEKRGRPDIAHFCTLLALDSILNKKGLLNFWIHTYDDKIITFKKDVRIPRNYERWKGLMEQLLYFGQVPPSKSEWLIKAEEKGLKEFIKENRFDRIILMSEKGEKIHPRELARYLTKFKNPVVLIGGFQSGDFKEETKKIAQDIFSISDETLMAWTVLSEIIVNYEAEILKNI